MKVELHCESAEWCFFCAASPANASLRALASSTGLRENGMLFFILFFFSLRWDCVPEGFGKELFESDVDNISDYITNSMKRTPVLANAEITSTVSGPITYAPDAIPLLGPDAKVPNMWLALGTGYGIGLAGK